jgi:hypothetical protein
MSLLRRIFTKYHYDKSIHVRNYNKRINNIVRPSSEFITLEKVIQVDNVVVSEFLTINNNFDRVVLFDNRSLAQDAMDKKPRNVKYAASLDMAKLTNEGGMKKTTFLRPSHHQIKIFEDSGSQLRNLEGALMSKQRELNVYNRDIENRQLEVRRFSEQERALNVRVKV